ncbi:diacylglycerol O-acyltransferase [Mycobacterium sp. IS-1742]|uniref:WS/DGAT/MGAT family O-acyltransferase n=1 Tax=Mycobacterium sp. IS-1742 TaxID=1772285 RepID=UPI00073FECBB|nr:wax ester/triacylglycerol synthase family O-acyltransferase [Mycobacterium sp. IS-1742]KUI32473.1 diacylglycerol O-acyltransferase [Mycobacterium sp. IS-1742]
MKRLNGMDALLLYSETPNVHTHTLKIAILSSAESDSVATLDGFRRTLERRLPLLEPLRYKLVEIPGRLHHPMWLQNCEVDLDYHLRRVRVPAPGGRRELDHVIGEIASTQLDRRYPLWEFYFADGLADGRWALIGKVHHALADGVASANLLARLMDVDGAGCAASTPAEPCAPPSSLQLLRAAGRDHVRQLAEMPATARDVAIGSWRLRRRTRERGETPDFAQLMRAPATFLNHVVSPVRRFGSDTLPLDVVKTTARKLGMTINDLVLGMATGALRTLSFRYDGAADEPIVASVPLSTDQSTERVTGNEIGGLAVSLPVHIADPLERLRLVSEATAIAKDNQRLFDQELYGRLMGYVPPAVATRALQWVAAHDTDRRLMNIPISNVPGPRIHGHFDGARVDEIYSVGPLAPGCGMNITVWSYVDQLNISVITDDVTIADTTEATDALLAAFDEIRFIAGV